MSEWITNRRRAASRLSYLARELRAISRRLNGMRFNLELIAQSGTGDMPRSLDEAAHCGFEGCSMGYAALLPRFRKAGLRLGEYGQVMVRGEEREWEVSSFDVCAEFFGISGRASLCIFDTRDSDWREGAPRPGDLDPHDPIAAAERIERFCRDNGIPVEAS